MQVIFTSEVRILSKKMFKNVKFMFSYFSTNSVDSDETALYKNPNYFDIIFFFYMDAIYICSIHTK